MTTIRHTTAADIEAVMQMYDHSRNVMRANGNHTQWVGYPTRDYVEEDIRCGASRIIEANGQPIGTFAVVPGVEPTYGVIAHGRWIDNVTPYATVHRIAAMPNTHGIADVAFAYSKEQYDHLRVDTHADNHAMRHIMDKEGFVYCGIVFMDDGSPRVAYEWWRYDTVPASLKDWVEEYILPQYDAFDTAHRRDHARRVIARAMQMQPTAMAYTAAAMHDIGLCEGRDTHHLTSARMIRSCKELLQWFSDEEIETIAQAAEDHRASATTPPRSTLGAIVAEADRDVEPETIVRRTVEYSLSHYPDYNREQHWQRCLDHLHEKYAEGGYIKLWLPDSPNAAPLAALRTLIADEQQLRNLFNTLCP